MASAYSENKKRVCAQTVVFSYGEGEAECAFICHIISFSRGCGVQTIKGGYAGGRSPGYIIQKAFDNRVGRYYDQSFILLDTDKPWLSVDVKKAKNGGFILIGSEPCLEGLFITILEKGKDVSTWTSEQCKKYFRKYIKRDCDKTDPKKYAKIFPIDLLNERRKEIKQLDQLMKLILGK